MKLIVRVLCVFIRIKHEQRMLRLGLLEKCKKTGVFISRFYADGGFTGGSFVKRSLGANEMLSFQQCCRFF